MCAKAREAMKSPRQTSECTRTKVNIGSVHRAQERWQRMQKRLYWCLNPFSFGHREKQGQAGQGSDGSHQPPDVAPANHFYGKPQRRGRSDASKVADHQATPKNCIRVLGGTLSTVRDHRQEDGHRTSGAKPARDRQRHCSAGQRKARGAKCHRGTGPG